ncbi:MAG: thiosulfate oxidation carrier protein SoxY [Pseudomonadota bacterium]
MNVTRRRVIALIGVFVSTIAAIGRVRANDRPFKAFQSDDFNLTMAELFGGAVVDSDAIKIGATDLAENGAVVPVKVEASLPGVKRITLLVPNNPVPLVGQFEMINTDAFIATRIKMGGSDDIVAVVETAGGAFQARKHVEVAIGGCGD